MFVSPTPGSPATALTPPALPPAECPTPGFFPLPSFGQDAFQSCAPKGGPAAASPDKDGDVKLKHRTARPPSAAVTKAREALAADRKALRQMQEEMKGMMFFMKPQELTRLEARVAQDERALAAAEQREKPVAKQPTQGPDGEACETTPAVTQARKVLADAEKALRQLQEDLKGMDFFMKPQELTRLEARVAQDQRALAQAEQLAKGEQ